MPKHALRGPDGCFVEKGSKSVPSKRVVPPTFLELFRQADAQRASLLITLVPASNLEVPIPSLEPLQEELTRVRAELADLLAVQPDNISALEDKLRGFEALALRIDQGKDNGNKSENLDLLRQFDERMRPILGVVDQLTRKSEKLTKGHYAPARWFTDRSNKTQLLLDNGEILLLDGKIINGPLASQTLDSLGEAIVFGGRHIDTSNQLKKELTSFVYGIRHNHTRDINERISRLRSQI